jgi:pimeloyl-ACP methyl ester carboxylesterase
MTLTTPKNIPENPSQILTLPWAFGNFPVELEVFPINNNPQVLVNLHGTFGSRRWGDGNYARLAESIQDESLANVVLYWSSRKPSEAQWKLSYDEKQKLFEWKTFEQEVEDARNILKHIVTNSNTLFWVDAEKLEITLQWNSLWGILAFYVASEFPQIKNIVTIWTGLRTEKWAIPILDTFPLKEELLAKLWQFQGNYYMAYGTNDAVFSQEAFDALYQGVTASRQKGFWKFLGVDHSFSGVDGVENSQPYGQVIENTKALFEKWTIPTTEFSFVVPQVGGKIQDTNSSVQALMGKPGFQVADTWEDIGL